MSNTPKFPPLRYNPAPKPDRSLAALLAQEEAYIKMLMDRVADVGEQAALCAIARGETEIRQAYLWCDACRISSPAFDFGAAGWRCALCEGAVAPPGSAEQFLRPHSATRRFSWGYPPRAP